MSTILTASYLFFHGDIMRKVALIALVLLVVGVMLIPAVSADEITIDKEYGYNIDTSTETPSYSYSGSSFQRGVQSLILTNMQNRQNMGYIGIVVPEDVIDGTTMVEGENNLEYTLYGETNPCHIYISRQKNYAGTVTSSQVLIFFENWDTKGNTGSATITFNKVFMQILGARDASATSHVEIRTIMAGYTERAAKITSIVVSSYTEFRNHLIVTDQDNGFYNISIIKQYDNYQYPSRLQLEKNGSTVFYNEGNVNANFLWEKSKIDTVKIITSLKTFTANLRDDADEPDGPDDQSIIRQGTVTMTDHNGTSISGFEVTAENVYTGQSYNVSTDSDIAIMSLPMDRTITLRNPQTGEYEDTVVGYYRFFGQKSGYKMLNEDGIHVAVIPAKYSSYQLCNILVTSESGYLSGQHKFQIRSRADNSILQTGTVSAKSATTGEWFNTTVSDGIATLILPYDTSNSISQYAGNYYVYATSPGYVDSDYGTQIVVMPHTVSEINNVLLTPIGGIPPAGNVTLRIQVFSETGPGVTNAEIFIAGVVGEGSSIWDTYTASTTGYLAVSVPGN